MSGIVIAVIIIVAVLAVVMLVITSCLSVRIVSETNFCIVERLGKYKKTMTKGVNFMAPYIDKIRVKNNFKEKVFDYPAQHVITKDNATIQVDTTVYLKIFDPKLFAYGAEDPFLAIEFLTSTTLRNLIGELELDEALTSREIINAKLTKILDEASDAWGIKVKRIEIQNIIPPKEVQEAMTKQMQAERIKRAQILEASAEKESKILRAQGEYESTILRAKAEKESMIERATGKKQAIELITTANISTEYLQLQSIEQLEKLANGHATKIIIPPNLADVAKSMSVAKEVLDLPSREEAKVNK
ncbi:SPFH domain-containing protein [Mycoplasma sp. 4404]|uniref:SPFH domain-containing protein n=1 Tax=Mycoplasma sp. 4404 TaxID=3108530 RepID=UPI002B1E7C34|nr:SPFH domain-containing protein [Mycoplasma sp. 4404]MEA4162458.1 SPFH domain-containing protein [Mycoplasma sp. 4404]